MEYQVAVSDNFFVLASDRGVFLLMDNVNLLC